MEEVLAEGKHFKLVKEEDLPQIVEILEEYLPASIKFHQTVKTYLNTRIWDFHFYVTKTWPDERVIMHFPGMTLSPNGKMYESFGVFCPSDQLDRLELLLEEDVLIDWTRPLYMNYTHRTILERIEELYAEIGTVDKIDGDIFILTDPPEDENDSTELVFAEDAEILQLTPEHASIVHELYPLNKLECIEVFERLFEKLPSYGVFAANGELAAWIIQSYYGALFSMQTKPEYRRKGYGSLLAKYLTKVVQSRGYLPFVVIRPDNDASKSLYTKLGFKKNFETVRAILRPHEMYASDGQGGGTKKINEEGAEKEEVNEENGDEEVGERNDDDEAVAMTNDTN